jgi:signal transduction histidine kinase
VFLNLMLNAVDAIAARDSDAASSYPAESRGGQVHVRTTATREPPGVRVVFADDGVGISPEEQDVLFEPFHTTKEVGVGLGLYISKNIVQDHGGRIEVESEQGKGATFTVWLPSEPPT